MDAGLHPDVAVQLRSALERRVGDAVYADELGRDALPHLRVVVGRLQNAEARVGVEVDEPRRDDVARRIDYAGRLEARGVPAMNRDGVALHEYGGVEARAAAAVYDQSVADQQVKHLSVSSRHGLVGGAFSLSRWRVRS